MYEFSKNRTASPCIKNTLDWSQDENHGGNAGQIGVYMEHIEDVLPDEKWKNDKATLQGKRGKLLEATTTSCAALFLDIL